ncbi:hypothetical protein [Paraburkholderia tuberum]|uniref:hypothetical protein n=1 Tax=Paraburkholderia TaxID=1822464 RepID=UPI00115FC90D|nr:hypothetical protein [Paraburkholderia tuberum]
MEVFRFFNRPWREQSGPKRWRDENHNQSDGSKTRRAGRQPSAGVSPLTAWTRKQNNGVETNKKFLDVSCSLRPGASNCWPFLKMSVRQHCGDHERLGVAVLMIYLRYPAAWSVLAAH